MLASRPVRRRGRDQVILLPGGKPCIARLRRRWKGGDCAIRTANLQTGHRLFQTQDVGTVPHERRTPANARVKGRITRITHEPSRAPSASRELFEYLA